MNVKAKICILLLISSENNILYKNFCVFFRGTTHKRDRHKNPNEDVQITTEGRRLAAGKVKV